MSAPIRSASAAVNYNTLYILSGNLMDFWDNKPGGRQVCHGGLLFTPLASIEIVTGMVIGEAPVTVHLSATDPGPDVGDWQAVTEASAHADADGLRITSMDEGLLQEELNHLSWQGMAGWYRVRVHAVNRDVYRDTVGENDVERYLIQIWPEDMEREPVVCLALDDASRDFATHNDEGQPWSASKFS